MRIRFITSVNVMQGKRFNAGEVHDLPVNEAQHWIRDGTAVAADEPETASVVPPERAVRKPARPRKMRSANGDGE